VLNIQEANYDQLKTAREEINQRIRDMERAAIAELEQRAAQFGFSLSKNGYQPAQKPKATHLPVSDGSISSGVFLGHHREVPVADGFVAAIDACGNVLGTHFPRTGTSRDELPDRIYVI
jgi:hypothetical protein